MARVTGIGGIFLKARDTQALAAWYAQHLGFELSPISLAESFPGPTRSPPPPA
jgi:hypothetical protein